MPDKTITITKKEFIEVSSQALTDLVIMWPVFDDINRRNVTSGCNDSI